MRILVLLFSFFALTLAQREDKIIIDKFNGGGAIILYQGCTLRDNITCFGAITASSSDEFILGGERDQYMEQTNGPQGSVGVSTQSDNMWVIDAPRNTQGFARLQYDGVDYFDFVVDGLGGIDFMADDADACTFSVSTDIGTSVHIIVYSTNGASSEYSVYVPGGNIWTDIDAYFTDFVGTADFEDVGALELIVDFSINGALDAAIQFFRTTGPI